MARFAGAGGRGSRGGGRGRGRRPHPGRGKPQAGHGAAIVDQEQSASYRPMGAALTIQEIAADKLTKIAEENWSTAVRSKAKAPAFKPSIVDQIYTTELNGDQDTAPKLKQVMLLEISQYLENYLWPNFDEATATYEHVMSIILMVNEKFRENVPAWDGFSQRENALPGFFNRVTTLKTGRQLRQHEKVSYLMFAINAFQSLENSAVRARVLKLASLPLWHALSEGRLQLELHAHEQLDKAWRRLAKRDAKAAQADQAHIPAAKQPEANKQKLLYCERFVEFLTDLLSQLPTRRFIRTLLEDRAILIKCRMSALFQHSQARLFVQLVDLFQFYMMFPIDDHTGDPVSDEDVTAAHYEKVQQVQRLFFKHVHKLRDLALANCGSVEKRDTLRKYLNLLEPQELKFLVTQQLRLVSEDDPWADRIDFLMEVMVSTYERRRFQTEVINELPLYPTESILWDENQVPDVHYTGQTCLALPKLNLQFLTFHDYLLRNFNLFRLEATYEIREDISDVIDMRGDIRSEWDETKQHDVLFLLTIRPPDQAELALMQQDGAEPHPAEKFGLAYVRGCEVMEVKDEEGGLMNDFTGRVRREDWHPPNGFRRTVTVAMDTAQYQMDINHMQAVKGEDLYGTFNLENNFKAVLESIRDLMNEDTVMPDWLHDIFLGYGDPAQAKYTNMPADQLLQTIDFKDTFLDAAHVKESFPGNEVTVQNGTELAEPQRPFKVTFAQPPAEAQPDSKSAKKRKKKSAGAEETENGVAAAAEPVQPSQTLIAESYTPPDPGPYPQDKPPENPVRFTPVQVEAIKSGVQPGLTMVVGPPGTGKTDTAVQIMHVLYHNCPGQRTLLITHSNQALNDLFEKILERDVPARYLLRLGMGEQELATEMDFSRVGRVNAMLARRLELLAEVEKLARQFGVAEDVAYTCETAAHFWLLHVLSRWEKFLAQAQKKKTPDCIKDLFPFKAYFADAPETLFAGTDYEADLEKARGCWRHLRTMFQELEECRAFELLKGQADRVNYLMTKQAKIVAMTCTHAALKRREFLQLGLKYDNLLMEESAQILEIETFIPMLLQRQEDGYSRLKRVILIGDHHQLPPVVKNMAFQKYSHLDQSLFTRFIRLGTPYIQLNAQGRARPSISKLYNWRYQALGDLPSVSQQERFRKANAGLAYDYQFIDTPDFEGRGETVPVPYFFQNLAEAEYVVTLYQYMRLLGYPAEKISMLTTYNGQKALLKDVVERRCAHHPAFGVPHKIATVDKYQGQQNDYILLSLVRTRAVGHIRDVRRLVVALSRARLGLYIFGRAELFANCYELRPAMKQLLARPQQLHLHPSERVASCQRNLKTLGKPTIIPGLPELAGLVGQMAAQWEARAQQQATHMDTDAETPDDKSDAAGCPETASATDAATTSEVGATTAKHQVATAAAAGTSRAPGSKASAVTQDRTDAQEEAITSGAGEDATQSSDAVAGMSGAVEADEGPAVDANADASLSDVVADARASEAVAGVSTEPDSTSMDAVENRRQKKKKKATATS
ncbi:MAG: embryo defective protein [Trebouxia sp. A1-2]|nr:MAG: embryo defective protein [Trebouxia sp. A1-2]